MIMPRYSSIQGWAKELMFQMMLFVSGSIHPEGDTRRSILATIILATI
jgi:hypothetical protein